MLPVLVAVILIILVYLVVKEFLDIKGLPPGPWGLPILGSLLRLSPTTPYLSLTQLADSYGPIYSLRLGRVMTIVLSDPKLIREALGREEFAGRADLFLTHGIMQGYGLICSEGKLWREQRNFVASTLKTLGMVKYGPRRLKLEERILDGVSETVEYLKSQEGREVDASRTLLHSVGNVVNSLVFGRCWGWSDPTWRWLQHLAEDGVKHIGIAGPLNFLPFLRIIPMYRKTMHFLLDGKHKTHEVYQQIIDAHPSDKDDDFIAAFVKEQNARGDDPGSFTQPQFHHLLADLFGAGVDTTLTTLRWFLIFVALHQDIQKRIQAEMSEVCGDSAPRLSDVPSLPLLQAAVAEAQRLRPVVPVGIPRGCDRDTSLGGYRIPRGAMVIPLQWAVHTDPRHWRDPLAFLPDRFLDPEGRFVTPQAFLPFQTGKRGCVGEELARMILLVYASRLLHHFCVSLPSSCDDPLDSQCGITLVPTLRALHFHPRTEHNPPGQRPLVA